MGFTLEKKLEALRSQIKEVDQGTNVIPEDQKPDLIKNLNNLKFNNKEEAEQFKSNLTNELATFRTKDRTAIIQKTKNDINTIKADDPVQSATLKLNKLRNNIVLQKFKNLHPQVQEKIVKFGKDSELNDDEMRNFVAQSTVMPQGLVEEGLSMLTGKRPDQVRQIISGWGDAFNANKRYWTGPFTKEIDIDRANKMKEVVERINTQETSSGLKKLIESKGKEAVIDEVVQAQSKLPKQGGTITSLLFSILDRDAQFGAAVTTAAGALFSKDPEAATKYAQKTEELVKNASSGNLWLSPKKPVDDIDVFQEMFGVDSPETAKFLDENQKNIDTMLGPLVKTTFLSAINPGAAIKETFKLNKAVIESDWKVTVDPQKLMKDVSWNSMVTIAGFAKSMIGTPLGVTTLGGGKVVGVGAKGLKSLKLSKGTRIFKTANLKRVLNVVDDFEKTSNKALSKIKELSVAEMKLADDMIWADDLPISSRAVEPGSVPFAVSNDEVVNTIKTIRDNKESLSKIKKMRDDIVSIDAKLRSGDTLVTEANVMAKRLEDNVNDLAIITKTKMNKKTGLFTSTPQEYQVLVKDGMQSLSRTGVKELKKLRKGTGTYNEQKALVDELTIAKKALENPKLVDKGGVKLLGLTVPGTPEAFDATGKAVSKALSSVPLLNKFPGVPRQAVKRINEYFREYDGRMQVSSAVIDDITAGLSKTESARVSIAVATDNMDKLPDSLRAVATKVRKSFDDMNREGNMMNEDFIKELRVRGFDDDAIEKAMKDGGDIIGDYIDNYMPQIYNNKKFMKALKSGSEKDLVLAIQKTKNNVGLNPRDRFALKREIPTLRDAYQIGIKDPSDAVKMETAFARIAEGVDVQKNINVLKKLGKKGLDPELDLKSLMISRYNSYNKAVAKRRMNIDLAKELGIKSTMTKYYENAKAFDIVQQGDFMGVALPKDVRVALMNLDKPLKKQALRTEVQSGFKLEEAGNLGRALTDIEIAKKKTGLAMLESLDKANNFFKKSVTVVWPKFVSRNMLSNFGMNTMDIGAAAWNPKNIIKAGQVVTNPKGAGKFVFKNKFGQTLTGDELYAAARENGVFLKLSQVAEAQGAKSYGRDFLAMTPTGAASQFAEDHARFLNFMVNWQRGHTFQESSKRSRQFLIDYGNLARGEKEIVNRVIPFYQFFKDNTINVMNTLVKDPMKVLGPQRAVEGGLKIAGIGESSAPPENVKLYPGQAPIFGEEGTGPGGERTIRQITSTSFTTEDLDRYFGIVDNMYQWWINKDTNQDAAERSFKNAKKQSVQNLMPVFQAPLYVVDRWTGANTMRDRKLNDTMAYYIAQTPKVITDMAGITFYTNKRTGDPEVSVSPISMMVFQQLGGGRALSTAGVLTEEHATVVDNMISLFSPISTKKVDLDAAEEMDLYIKSKEAKAAKKRTKALFKKELDAIRTREKFLKMGSPLDGPE